MKALLTENGMAVYLIGIASGFLYACFIYAILKLDKVLKNKK